MSSTFTTTSHDRMAQHQHHQQHHHHHQQPHHLQNVNHQPPSRYMSPLRRHHSHGAVPGSTFYQHQHPNHPPPTQHNDHPHLHRSQANHHHPSQGHTQPSYMMNCYPNTNGWAGVPLISTAVRRPRKHMLSTNNNNNAYLPTPQQQPQQHRPNIDRCSSIDFDEGAMLRLAAHAHGAPLILTGRHQRPKGITVPNHNPKHHSSLSNTAYFNPNHININQLLPKHFSQPDCEAHFNSNLHQNQNTSDVMNVNAAASQTSQDNHHEDNSQNIANQSGLPEMCLPRIIKPRKRRKKDRKPLLAGSESSQSPVVDIETLQQYSQSNSNFLNGVSSEFVDPAAVQFNTSYQTQPPIQQQLYDNSASSSAADLSQQSSDSEPTSSCSCRLCDPSGRIWAFPLRRSCSDQSDAELAARRKSIGVIGSNRPTSARYRSEWHSSTLMDSNNTLAEFASGSRKGSLSDSGDSGCDILSGLSFTDDLLLSSPSPPNSATDVLLDPFRFPDATTASAVFSESINEISRKMMDVLELRSCSTGSSGGSDEDSSGRGGSGFGDIADCQATMFSEEFLLSLKAASSLSLLGVAEQAEQRSWMSAVTPSFTSENHHHYRINEDQPNNCFDMVWNASQMLPVQELR